MTIVINFALSEDAQRLLCLHADTGAVYGMRETHCDIDQYRAGIARRELLKRALIRPTHGGGFTITPNGHNQVLGYRGS